MASVYQLFLGKHRHQEGKKKGQIREEYLKTKFATYYQYYVRGIDGKRYKKTKYVGQYPILSKEDKEVLTAECDKQLQTVK